MVSIFSSFYLEECCCPGTIQTNRPRVKGRKGHFTLFIPNSNQFLKLFSFLFFCGSDVAELKVIYFSNIFISSTTKTFPIGFNCVLQKQCGNQRFVCFTERKSLSVGLSPESTLVVRGDGQRSCPLT